MVAAVGLVCAGAAVGLGALGPWGFGAKRLACESDTEEGGLNYKVFKVTFLSFRFSGCPSVA